MALSQRFTAKAFTKTFSSADPAHETVAGTYCPPGERIKRNRKKIRRLNNRKKIMTTNLI
jgi:hypothetical protein